MDESEAKQLLEQLADLQAQSTLLAIDKQDKIDQILGPLKQEIGDVEFEYKDKFEAIDERVKSLTEKVKEAIVALGHTVTVGGLQAVYTKPRVSWNSKMLEGMAKIIPQLEQARTEGDPSVAIRKAPVK